MGISALNSFFEGFTSTKFRQACCCDFDGFTSTRVAAVTGCTLTDIKSAETDQRYQLSFLQRAFYRFQRAVQCTTSGSLGNIGLSGNRIDEFRFIHNVPFPSFIGLTQTAYRPVIAIEILESQENTLYINVSKPRQ